MSHLHLIVLPLALVPFAYILVDVWVRWWSGFQILQGRVR